MSVSFVIGKDDEQVFSTGMPHLLSQWFSNIYYHLEPNGWGTRYPVLMNEFYQGKLSWRHIEKATRELESVRQEFHDIESVDAIWDDDNLTAVPPSGREGIDGVFLDEFFLNYENANLFDMISHIFTEAATQKKDVYIKFLPR